MKRAFPLLLVALAIGCADPPPPPVLFEAPSFELNDSTGQAFSSDELAGKVWVADFVFTSCRGPCPLMSRHMRELQEATANLPDARLITITVDPERDTPPVLAAYARRFGAAPERWRFLTGDKAAIYELIAGGFKLAVDDGGESGAGIITHSVRFVLVDREGRIRGYYAGNEPGVVETLARDVKRLLEES